VDNLYNIRGPKDADKERELFRTPRYAFEPLLDFRRGWFGGDLIDPSAGDGRMIALAVEKGLAGDHLVGDIAPTESARWAADPHLESVEQFTGCYLSEYQPDRRFAAFLTNPPFTKAQAFVDKAKTHVDGPICILQSVAWMGTQKRSRWLSQESGLVYVLNLARRPKWEFDDGKGGASNIWDFAWYVFCADYKGNRPEVGWLFDAGAA
jgi:hypothetical protein